MFFTEASPVVSLVECGHPALAATLGSKLVALVRRREVSSGLVFVLLGTWHLQGTPWGS